MEVILVILVTGMVQVMNVVAGIVIDVEAEVGMGDSHARKGMTGHLALLLNLITLLMLQHITEGMANLRNKLYIMARVAG